MAVYKRTYPSREQWLEARRNRIGGSDAAACMGLNPYKDNVTFWEEKMGLTVPEDISDRPYVRYGTEAETYLRGMFALDFPEYRVEYSENNMYLNTRYPWMHASLDGVLVDPEGRYGVLEIKTTEIQRGSQRVKWDGRIPDNYYCQVLHYLAVTEYEFAVLKAQLKSGTGMDTRMEIRHYLIERSEVEEDIQALVEAEKKMYDCIQSGRRPDLILPAI